jgi:hypothetical protein
MTRTQAIAIMRDIANGELGGKTAAGTPGKRPFDIERFKRYCVRAKLNNVTDTSSSCNGFERNRVCETIGSENAEPPSPRALSAPDVLLMPEKMFHSGTELIKKSFITGAWHADGFDDIIQNSPTQAMEKHSLHSLLGNLDIACKAASSGDYGLAGEHWQRGFDEIAILVKGQYHDIIPNLTHKINDLNHAGYGDVASKLKDFVSQSCAENRVPTGSRSVILRRFARLDLADMVRLKSGSCIASLSSSPSISARCNTTASS